MKCYAVENHPNDSRCRIDPDGNNTPFVMIQVEQKTDVSAVCFQNTGHGWWNEGEIAQTLRTACGGDRIKANLIAEVQNG